MRFKKSFAEQNRSEIPLCRHFKNSKVSSLSYFRKKLFKLIDTESHFQSNSTLIHDVVNWNIKRGG